MIDEVEHDILVSAVREAERSRTQLKHTEISVDEELVETVYRETGKQYTVEQLELGARRCIDRDWLQLNVLGGDTLENLPITTRGEQVARATLAERERLRARSLLERCSDWLEQRKGVMTALSLLISLLALGVSIYALLTAGETVIVMKGE